MSDEPIPAEPETPDRDAAVDRAFHFFLSRKGWQPSALARESGVKVGVVHQAVTGYAPSVATLRRLCESLKVDLWLFLLMGDVLRTDDPDDRQRYAEGSEARRLLVMGVNRLLEEEGSAAPTSKVPDELKDPLAELIAARRNYLTKFREFWLSNRSDEAALDTLLNRVVYLWEETDGREKAEILQSVAQVKGRRGCRDPAVGGALRYFLGAKRWRPSDLAKAADVSTGALSQVVMGYAPSVATLRHLCKSLEVDLWVFFMIGELLNEEDPAASLAAGIDRLKAASADILISAEEEPA